MSALKIFGIGFHKTGTTSLAWALAQMGYRVTGPNGVDDPYIERNVYNLARRLLPDYDAFQDNPWPALYRFADEQCPGSKFILTVRDDDAWLRSVVRHFGAFDTPMRQWLYGAAHPLGNEAVYLARYRKHNAEVQSYFKRRSRDLLILDVAAADAWAQLGRFLERPVPAAPLPKLNPGNRPHAGYSALAKRSRRILLKTRQLLGVGS